MNLWHDITLGDNAPYEINCIIETPKGSLNKFELDKDTGLIKLDRVNYSSAPYPFDYGFAPRTLWGDGDPLDIVVLTTVPLLPGILLTIRPVAVMDMIDSGESDYKIIAVPVDDKRWDNVQALSDINPHTIKEIQHFFETYKLLKGKPAPVEIPGVYDTDKAIEAVQTSIRLYQEKFGA